MGKRLDRWKRLIMEKLRKASDEKKEQKKSKDPAIKPEKEAEKAEKEEKEEKKEKEKKEKDKKETKSDQKKKKEKESKEKEAEKEEKEAEKEADEKAAEKEEEKEAGEKADEKEAEEAEKEGKQKDQKETKSESKKAKKGKTGKNGKKSTEDSQTAAVEEDQELAGDLLKHMLEYEQINEKPENRVLNELVSSGKTDDLVKILSADDQFRAEHKNTEPENAGKDAKTTKTSTETSQTSQITQNLADALELARENEKETKLLEEQREKMGYQDLLAMEAPTHGGKAAAKRIIRRPVKELKLPEEAAQNKPMEPPPMGPKLPSRRKKKEQDD